MDVLFKGMATKLSWKACKKKKKNHVWVVKLSQI